MKLDITPALIYSALSRLGIRHGHSEDKKGRTPCLCTFHQDKNLGNAYIWSTGFFKCYACGKASNIVGIIRHVQNCSFKEAVKFLGLEYHVPDRFDSSLEKRQSPLPETEKEAEDYALPELTLKDLNPAEWLYTRLRGYTPEFIERFQVKECTRFPYSDYLIIPIPGSTFEARKLKEAEKLYEFYNLKGTPTETGLKRVKAKFAMEVKQRKLRFSKGKLWENGEQIRDNQLYYLMRPKVLYPAHSNQKATLFNLPNLNLDEDLYVCEGTASLPKVTRISPNATSVFGVALSEDQFDLLKTFRRRKIVIPNDDEASVNFIWELCQRMSDVWVLNTSLDDTDDGFEQVLRTGELIEGTRYVMRKQEWIAKV